MGKRYHFDSFIRSERDEIIRECCLTQQEEAVFVERANGRSQIQVAEKLHMSSASVTRTSAKIHAKIEAYRGMQRRRSNK